MAILHPRRPKTKTYHGCWSCRQRHRKCDLRKPHCYVCERDGVSCLGYNVRLCWDHSKSDDLRRTMIYQHHEFEYMCRTDDEIKDILDNIDVLSPSSIMPFAVFELPNSTTRWIEVLSEELFPLDGSDSCKLYVQFTRDHLQQHPRLILAESIRECLARWDGQSTSLDPFIHQLKRHSTPDHETRSIVLTAMCNCLFMLTRFTGNAAPLCISLESVLRDYTHHDEFSVALRHIANHFLMAAHTIDRRVPIKHLRQCGCDANFIVPHVGFSNFFDITKVSVDVKNTSKNLDVRMDVFRLEDSLWTSPAEYVHSMNDDPSPHQIFHRISFLFYMGVGAFFLDNVYTRPGTKQSKRWVLKHSRVHLKELTRFFRRIHFVPGVMWLLAMIGIVADLPEDRDAVLGVLRSMARFKVEQVDVLLKVLPEIWRCSEKGIPHDPYEMLRREKIGVLL